MVTSHPYNQTSHFRTCFCLSKGNKHPLNKPSKPMSSTSFNIPQTPDSSSGVQKGASACISRDLMVLSMATCPSHRHTHCLSPQAPFSCSTAQQAEQSNQTLLVKAISMFSSHSWKRGSMKTVQKINVEEFLDLASAPHS